MYRRRGGSLEVLLVHPGGPFWAKKDAGAWSIPKGEYGPDEEPLAAAIREFAEETGIAPRPPFLPLGEIRQPGGKLVAAWAFEGDCDAAAIRSNSFSMEWPQGSGKMREYPEIDRGGWFDLESAGGKILKGQVGFLNALAKGLGF